MKEPGELLSNGLFNSSVSHFVLKSISFCSASRGPRTSFLPGEVYKTNPLPRAFSGISFVVSQSPLLFLFSSQLTVKLGRSGSALPSPLDFKSLLATRAYLLCKIYLATHYKLQSLCDPWVPDRELKRVFRYQASKEIEENI